MAFLASAAIISSILFIFVLQATGGVFGFSLDDPYIGLAFASHILDGHFGINLNEAVDPSSSILFPFLLATLLKLGGGPVTVFLFGLSFVAVTIFILLDLVRDVGIDLSRIPTWRIVVAALAILLGLNLIGIVFTGLEHPLHIADTLACLLGVVRTVRTGQMPRWLPVVLVLNPLDLVSEGLLSVWGLNYRTLKQAWSSPAPLTFAAGLVLVGSYSFYLHHLGLPLLPSSVMSKVDRCELNWQLRCIGTRAIDNLQQNLGSMGPIQLLAILALAAIAFSHKPAARGIALFAAPANHGAYGCRRVRMVWSL